MRTSAGIGIAIAALLTVPLLAAAQTDELRSQIRTDIMSDPRSAQMSSAEIDGLVNALASEAEVQGSASAYLEAKETPDYSALFPPVENPNSVQAVSSPVVIALVFLIAIFLIVILNMLYRRRRRLSPANLQNIE